MTPCESNGITYFPGNGSKSRIRFAEVLLSVSLAATVFAMHSMIATTGNLSTAKYVKDNDIALSNAPPAPLASTTNYNRLARAVQQIPIGSLGPKGTPRHYFRYYDSLFYTALQFGADAHSSIEVGCAGDPFLQYLDWIDKRTCVAPYFVEYGGAKDKSTTKIDSVTADFMDYQLPNDEKFDLLICSQVLEHVPNPAAFMKKMISTAKTSIISVPHDWADCGKTCNHVTHHITNDVLMEWSAPHVPIYEGVIKEEHDTKGTVMRTILVFKTEWE